ncbi:MAG: F0F1 ATP synthase subunit B [Clostridiales bacterium]|nr:F0F1 ATP synthase subunit B [Clostridiales bacterium]MBR6700782.1 F0F1 ATP synthase subunit B [Bacillota bacterium]
MEVYTGLVSFGWPWFFQIANTLILVALLAKFLFKPVNKMLEKRKNTIANDLSTAENQRVEAEALRADYEKKIKEIRIEADAILKEARNKADERAKEIIQEARDKSDDIIEKAQVEIERNQRNAYNELKDEVAAMAIMAAEKIIGEKMDDELNEKLVVKFIEEAGDVKWQN